MGYPVLHPKTCLTSGYPRGPQTKYEPPLPPCISRVCGLSRETEQLSSKPITLDCTLSRDIPVGSQKPFKKGLVDIVAKVPPSVQVPVAHVREVCNEEGQLCTVCCCTAVTSAVQCACCQWPEGD